MESDRAQSFNDRLNQWVASQGFWFQLKYSMSGKGTTGSGGYHLLQLTFRILVFLLVVSALGIVYLVKQTDTKAFSESLERALSEELGAKEGGLTGFQRQQGKLSINKFAAIGRDDAFFTDFSARNIGCKMGIFDTVRKPWKTGAVTISELNINLRAGAADASQAENLGKALFKERPGIEITAIDIEDASVTWGFSESAKGAIEHSQLKIRRSGSGWWMQFKRGTFSQNWLKGLEIEEITLVCNGSGVTVDKALFKKGPGRLDLSGMTIRGAEMPAVEATAKMKNLPIDGMLPAVADHLLEGTISGALKLSGSTNSREGISIAGRIDLGEGDGILLRDRIPLLRALRMVDAFNNYRRVNFQTGSFMLKSGGGNLELAEIDLQAADLMTLKGGMLVRPPTKEEKEKAANLPENPLLQGEEKEERAQAASDFTLKRAAKESQKKDATGKAGGISEKYDAKQEERQFAGEMVEKMAESLRYQGTLTVTIRADAFDQVPELRTAFPVDAKTGRIPLLVPIDGTLNLISFAQAEAISAKSKR